MKTILLRFGELVLKGKNKNVFIKQLKQTLTLKLKGLNCLIEMQHDRIYLHLQEDNQQQIEKAISYVSGIQSYSYIYKTEKDLDKAAELAVSVLKKEIKTTTTFKIETKRADKSFPMTSPIVSVALSKKILPHFDNLIVDVKNPEFTLEVEIRPDGIYLYSSKVKAMGGFPVGIGGKGLLMVSGGIDSPVAGYLMMKQGVEIELMHFESTPLTPLESVQKVIDIAKVLSLYTKNNKIKLHIVPILAIHEQILKDVDDPYIITILRRMMYRIAHQFAKTRDFLCLANGESIGQVASQTLESINTIENVTTIPVIRPLITYDKLDIITLSKKIETFDISIRPFNDCCSIYVPKNPIIHPTIEDAIKHEVKLDVEGLVNNALQNIYTTIVHPNYDIQLDLYGFEAIEALKNAFKKE